MSKKETKYISALKFGWLTAFYDPILRWTIQDTVFKSKLSEQANIQRGHEILDLGCGTATLTILVKKKNPALAVCGLDGDPEILKIARRKSIAAALPLELSLGYSHDLPFAKNSFDRVISSLFFHHLTRKNKLQTLLEVVRVLRLGGELHVVDWGKPRNAFMRMAFCVVQLLDGFESTSDNVKGLLPDLMRQAGLIEASEVQYFNTIYGTLSFYRAQKSEGPNH